MRFLASLFALTFLTLAGCPAATQRVECPPDGTGFANGTGLYCAYGVVIGGFRECPRGLPNRFDFPDGSFVCSDQPIGSRDAIPDDVCAAVSGCVREDPCEIINMLPRGAPCTDFGECRGECDTLRACVDGEVELLIRQCDAGIGPDVPWPTLTNVGVCQYVDYGSPCRVPCTAPPEARFNVTVQWDSAYCCTFSSGPYESFTGCRCTDGFAECESYPGAGFWRIPSSTCEFCPGTPGSPRDAGSAGPG